MRQLAAWEGMKSELEELECSIYAISVDNLEQATEVAGKGLTFPVAYGATKENSDAMGSWWTEDHHGGYIQPTEFLLGRGGTVWGLCMPLVRWVVWGPTRRCARSRGGSAVAWSKSRNDSPPIS